MWNGLICQHHVSRRPSRSRLQLIVRAKTDCFVGYLPAKALERILERRPVVLLTLAKRLLSLLSPLGG